MPQNIRRFQESINLELELIRNRVRDLIGDANWAEEGRYKEAILRKTISQFLPKNLNIGTGFIIGNDDHINGQNGIISKQLDIIIYGDEIPVVFREGDFVIVTETAVRAVIEVKSKIINYGDGSTNSLNTIISTLNELRNFPSFNLGENYKKRFVGIFSFEYGQDYLSERVTEALHSSDGLVNHISLGPHKFIRYWENTEGLPDVNFNERCYMQYNLQRLSFSYFISNLLHIVSNQDPVERYWFSFPIGGTKEIYREGIIRFG
jgi:hypothetical protein